MLKAWRLNKEFNSGLFLFQLPDSNPGSGKHSQKFSKRIFGIILNPDSALGC
jgi:hypothetical protein